MKSILAFALVAVASIGFAGDPNVTKVPVWGDFTCFDYTGTFKSGTNVLVIDWENNGSYDECFGVAPGRTIWHAWPKSGGWKQMPNSGRADDMWWAETVGRFDAHSVTVLVWSSRNLWCSTIKDAAWTPWSNCGFAD